ncbi:MAG: hypothetical protein COA79_14515 [Planctomycetota bacterium]|nr:MAG: hypothetical protein COA79_14515 [Planctomycetota bacterium]
MTLNSYKLIQNLLLISLTIGAVFISYDISTDNIRFLSIGSFLIADAVIGLLIFNIIFNKCPECKKYLGCYHDGVCHKCGEVIKLNKKI